MFKIAKQHWLLLGLHLLATAYTANVYPSGEKTETEEAGTQTQWQSSKNCKIDKDSLDRTSPPCIFSIYSSNSSGTANQKKKTTAKKEVNLLIGKVEYSEKEKKMLCVYEKNKSSSFVWLHTSIDEEGTKGMESLESFFKENPNAEDQKESLYDFFNNFTCPDVDSIDEESTDEDEDEDSSSGGINREHSSSDSSSNNDDEDTCSQQDAFLRNSLDLPKDSRSSPTELLKKSPIQVHYHREEVKCADNNDGESNGDSCLAGAYKIDLQVTFDKKKSGTTPTGAKRRNKSTAKDTGATLYLTSNEYHFITGPANTKGLAVNIDCEDNIALGYQSDWNIMNDRHKLYIFMLTNGKSVASYDNETLAVGSHFIKATDDKIEIMETESKIIYSLTPHTKSLFFCNKNEPTALINIPENNQPATNKSILSKTSSLPPNELPILTKPKKKETTSITTSITTTQKNHDVNLQGQDLSRHSKLNCPWPCSIL